MKTNVRIYSFQYIELPYSIIVSARLMFYEKELGLCFHEAMLSICN